MKFKVGDKVRILDETGEGRIAAIQGGDAMVDLGTGFHVKYQLKDLVPIIFDGNKVKEEKETGVTSAERKAVEAADLWKKQVEKTLPPPNKDTIAKRGPARLKRQAVAEEVDLHIYNLVPSIVGLTNGEMISIQLEHFQKKLDRAILNKASRIIFIHGVGEGRLRSEIRKILDSMGLAYMDGSYRKYGFGATEVLLK